MFPTTWTTLLLCLLIASLRPSSTTRNHHGAAAYGGSLNHWVPVGDPEVGRRPDLHRRPAEHRFRELDLTVNGGDSIFPEIRRSNIVDNRRDHRQVTDDRMQPSKKNKTDWKPRASGVSGSTTTTPRSNFWMVALQNVTTSRPTTVARRIITQPGRHRPTPSVKYFVDRHIGVDHDMMQIPVPILLELKNITNPIDFLNRYVVEAKGMQNNAQSGRNHSFAAPFAHAAGCTPQPTTVPVHTNARSEPEPYVMYFPSCTRVERCDGCCNTDLLECQPTKTEMASLQVLRVKYLGPSVNKFDISEPVIVELERHLQCDCLCRIKESDCRFYQTYRPNECRCECSNQHESVECVGERLWDPYTCQCRCRHLHDCSTGYFFNDQTCTCEVMKTRAKPAFRGF